MGRKSDMESDELKSQSPEKKNNAATDSLGNFLKPAFEHLRNIFLCATLGYGGYLLWNYGETLRGGEYYSQIVGAVVIAIAVLFLLANMVHGILSLTASIKNVAAPIVIFLFIYGFFIAFTIPLFKVLMIDPIKKGQATSISVEQCRQLLSGATLPSGTPNSTPASSE